jgi:dihydroorotate dehydrogenase electron transfer subunit
MISHGIVKKNALIAKDVCEMVIEAKGIKSFIPGQFINIYLNDTSMLLPRPISICDLETGDLTIVYKVLGKGTRLLSSYNVAETVRFSVPLGNGYQIGDDCTGKRIALVGGGIGIPPMAALGKALKGRNAVVDVYLGFQSEIFLCEKLKPFSNEMFIATDDGSTGFHGNVVALLGEKGFEYDEYFGCGPKAMLKALKEYTTKVGRRVQVSLEERMGCGYGACHGCACKINDKGHVIRQKVCKDGPVFFGEDVVWDE